MAKSRIDEPKAVATMSMPAAMRGGPKLAPARGLGWQVERDRLAQALFGTEAEPRRLGRYTVLRALGQGGMGTVLEAHDEQLDRRLAIKVLHAETSERHRQRLRREAQALAKLSHPNVVQVYEVGEVDDEIFIAMELVEGQPLDRWQQQERTWRECAKVYLQAGYGLAAAHAVGLVHRDFKPSNCIVDAQGRPRVLDFGLATEIELSTEDEVDPAQVELEDEPLNSSLTKTGSILGTLAYMPLEQLRGKSADERADQFSFCVSLYESLYGERPYEGSTVPTLVRSLREGAIRPAPRGTRVPARLRRLLLRGLATDPEDRWESMDSLLRELRRIVWPRRARWIALGGTGISVVVAAGVWQAAQQRCTGAAEQLAGVWDEQRAAQVRAAILDTGLSYAAETWERVRPRLDEYASAWIASHTEVCEATSVRHEQSTEVMDLRMECLRARRVALAEAVGVLAEANEVRVEKAVGLVTSLPGLARCDEIAALQAALPPPEDPAAARQIEGVRDELERARALRVAGEYDAALALVEGLVDRSDALGHAPLSAEVSLSRGSIMERLGRYDEAVEHLEAAYLLAAQIGHDTVEARAVSSLAFVVGNRLHRPEPGYTWAKTALALSRGPAVDGVMEARAQLDAGMVRHAEGKLDEALEHYRGALAIYEAEHSVDHPDLSSVLNVIGGATSALGRHEEALEYRRRALEISEASMGPRHPHVAAILSGMGNIRFNQGQPGPARELFERALEIQEQALHAEHPTLANTVNSLGAVAWTEGRIEEAVEHYEWALAIYSAALGPRHVQVARPLNNLGVLERQRGRPEQAIAYHRRALALRTESLGAQHVDVADSLDNLGDALLDADEAGEAREHFERGLSIKEAALGPRHPRLVFTLVQLATVLLDGQDSTMALEYAERAVAICEEAEVAPDRIAHARFVLARALGDTPRARLLAELARDDLASMGESKAEALARVEAWLAEHDAGRE